MAYGIGCMESISAHSELVWSREGWMITEQRYKYKVFSCYYGEGVHGKCFWFRIFGYGLYFKHPCGALTFSERYGYTHYKVFFGIKVRALKP